MVEKTVDPFFVLKIIGDTYSADCPLLQERVRSYPQKKASFPAWAAVPRVYASAMFCSDATWITWKEKDDGKDRKARKIHPFAIMLGECCPRNA